MIRQCQPLSKRKHFTVAQILDKSSAHLAEIELEQQKLREQSTSDSIPSSGDTAVSTSLV